MFCLVCTPFVPCGEWDIIGVSNGFIDVFICIPSAQGSKPAKTCQKTPKGTCSKILSGFAALFVFQELHAELETAL
jgi:hypothetical protein